MNQLNRQNILIVLSEINVNQQITNRTTVCIFVLFCVLLSNQISFENSILDLTVPILNEES